MADCASRSLAAVILTGARRCGRAGGCRGQASWVRSKIQSVIELGQRGEHAEDETPVAVVVSSCAPWPARIFQADPPRPRGEHDHCFAFGYLEIGSSPRGTPGWWFAICTAGAFFVTRRKRNAHCREVGTEIATEDGILADRRVKLGYGRPHGGAPKNPLFDVVLREVTVARPDQNAPLYLLTNDVDGPAAEIARLYKERWEIELLFKWLKQNLKIRRFLGRSENAVRTQICVAMIAFMLLRILHQTAARSFTDSTALLLTRLKLALLGPFSLRQHNTPPPRPPSLRPPNPQPCFAFR